MSVFPPELLNVPYSVRIDEVDTTISYIGKADPGSPDAAAVWQIQRLTVSGSLTSVLWAGGNDEFDKVWDNRASLIYS